MLLSSTGKSLKSLKTVMHLPYTQLFRRNETHNSVHEPRFMHVIAEQLARDARHRLRPSARTFVTRKTLSESPAINQVFVKVTSLVKNCLMQIIVSYVFSSKLLLCILNVHSMT